MRVRGRRGLGLKLLLSLGILVPAGVLVPTGTRAQPPGFYVTPSFSVAEVYDDNLFATARERQGDFISRFSPGIEASYQSAPFNLIGRYSFDAEVYARHPELTTAEARRNASVEARYATPLLTLSLTGLYATTQTPGEFNTDTGLQTARVPARRLAATPTLAYQLDPLSKATADYTFAKDESGGLETDLHSANLGYDRRLTQRDTAGLAYTFRHFAFAEDTSTAHAVTLGWTREITPLTTVALRAGPRFTEGSAAPEVAASIRRRLRHGELSFAYARSQATVVGERGVVETESFGATLAYRPLPALEVRLTPAFFTSSRAGLDARVYAVGAEAAYQLARRLSLVATYQFSLQQGSLTPGTSSDEEIRRNIVTLRLVVTQPYRVR